MPPAPPTSGFRFTADPSLAAYTCPVKEYIGKNTQFDIIATGGLVFSAGGSPAEKAEGAPAGQGDKLLLLQRAAHDSMPLHWEVPGGAVDDEDESVLPRPSARDLGRRQDCW